MVGQLEWPTLCSALGWRNRIGSVPASDGLVRRETWRGERNGLFLALPAPRLPCVDVFTDYPVLCASTPYSVLVLKTLGYILARPRRSVPPATAGIPAEKDPGCLDIWTQVLAMHFSRPHWSLCHAQRIASSCSSSLASIPGGVPRASSD